MDRQQDDPELHDLYAKKLLVSGWAGEVDDAEAAYIARELTRRPELRALWRVARFTRQRKKITPAIAKRLCRWWAEMPLSEDEGQSSDTVEPKTAENMRERSMAPATALDVRLQRQSAPARSMETYRGRCGILDKTTP